jgi:hypothetical protein
MSARLSPGASITVTAGELVRFGGKSEVVLILQNRPGFSHVGQPHIKPVSTIHAAHGLLPLFLNRLGGGECF